MTVTDVADFYPSTGESLVQLNFYPHSGCYARPNFTNKDFRQ